MGFDEFHAGVRPEDKRERIERLKAAGVRVAMVAMVATALTTPPP